jgi:hypothetical protein
MDIKRILTPLLLALLPLQTVVAAIDLTETGASTATLYGDCVDPCNQVDAFSIFSGPTSGGTGILSSMQTLTGAEIGNAGSLFANATILGGLNTPHLTAQATSSDGKFLGISATGIQGYTVTSGGDNQLISATVGLTGTVTNPLGNDLTELSAAAVLMKVSNPGDFLAAFASLYLLSDDAINLSQSTSGAVNLMDTIDLTVDEGDQFYLVGFLSANAGGLGSDSESLSTFTVSFDAASAAVIAPAAGPLPATILLLAPMLGLLTVRRQS